MARKQPQVTEQTRANLTSAFWELYQEKPIEKITVREITDRAGYNRATFYLYYRDVYDLFEQLEEAVLAQVRALVNERLLSAERLDLSQHMGVIMAMTQRFSTILPRLQSGDPSFDDRMKEIVAPLLDRFILPETGLTAAEQDMLREFYLSGLLSAIGRWLAHQDDMPIDRFIELVVHAVVAGAEGFKQAGEAGVTPLAAPVPAPVNEVNESGVPAAGETAADTGAAIASDATTEPMRG